LHWSREEIRKLKPEQFEEILKELAFQEQIEEYQRNYRTALLRATILNCTPRKDNRRYKAEDFVGRMPERESVNALNLARERGLKVPRKEG